MDTIEIQINNLEDKVEGNILKQKQKQSQPTKTNKCKHQGKKIMRENITELETGA